MENAEDPEAEHTLLLSENGTGAKSRKHEQHEQKQIINSSKESLMSSDGLYPNLFTASYLESLKGRDPQTADHFFKYFAPRLRMTLRAHRILPADQWDLSQETLVNVLKEVDKNSIRDPQRFPAFVQGVCKNVIRHHFSKQRPMIDIDDIRDLPNQDASPEEKISRREKSELVRAILDDFSPLERNLMRGLVFEERNPQELCKEFGITRNYCRVLLHRSRMKLEKAWKKRQYQS